MGPLLKMKKTVTLKKLALMSLTGVSLVAAARLIEFEDVMAIARKLHVLEFSIHPKLEKQEPKELESILKTARLMFKAQMASEPQSRDAHAKAQSCLKAEFTVSENLPSQYQIGVFKNTQRKYEAIVRYSNGSGVSQSDKNPDGRGMAVKLLNVDPVQQNILGTGHTQDFMMVNSPHFFIGSTKDYARMQEIKIQYKDLKRFFLEKAVQESIVNSKVKIDVENLPEIPLVAVVDVLAQSPLDLPLLQIKTDELTNGNGTLVIPEIIKTLQLMKLAQAPLEFKNAMELMNKKVSSMTTETYTSMTSFLLKSPLSQENDIAVKYIVKPVQCHTGVSLKPSTLEEPVNDNYLKEELIAKINKEAACFDFYLQPMPQLSESNNVTIQKLVEDPRLDFHTEPVLVAHLEMQAQDLTLANTSFCENLSFNPWQSMTEHQPLGGLNRARKVAVTASSIRRHLYNSKARQEPISSNELFDRN